jgi:hypothetical protein
MNPLDFGKSVFYCYLSDNDFNCVILAYALA